MELLPLDSRTDLARLLAADLPGTGSYRRLARPARSAHRALPARLAGIAGGTRAARAGRGGQPSGARTAVPQPCG